MNIVATLLVIAANALAHLRPAEEVKWTLYDFHQPPRFDPESLELLVFGAIAHLALLVFAVYQALPAQRERPLLRRIGGLYACACAADVLCVYLAYGVTYCLSGPLAFAGLVALLVIYLRRTDVPMPATTPRSLAELFFVHMPLGLYAIWLVVFLVLQFWWTFLYAAGA